MIRAIKIEMRKAIKNKLFLICIIIGCLVTFLNTYEFVNTYYKELDINLHYIDTFNQVNEVSTPFGRWIATEGFSLGSSLLYFIFPLLVAIPYGWSYCIERKSGYEKNVVSRIGRKKYYFSKFLAMFTSGGLAMVIPLIFNFICLSLFMPYIAPSASEDIYYGIFPYILTCRLFYGNPALYVIAVLLITFIFSGLIACISYTASLFTKKWVIAVISPFISLILLQYARSYVQSFYDYYICEFNPMFFIRGRYANITFPIVFIIFLIIVALTLGIIMLRGRKHEIF